MNKTLKILLEISICIFIITFSLEFLILFRPLYYFLIKYMRMSEATGYSYNEIKQGFDELMDFLVLHKDFKMGIFKCSENAKAHFYDCRRLFTINFIFLFASSIYIIFIYILNKRKHLITYNKLSIGMYGLFTFIIIGVISLIWSLIDFLGFFVFLHKIFFPFKTNFAFTYDDTIIYILPTELWINYGIILLIILLIFNLLIIINYIKAKRTRNKS